MHTWYFKRHTNYDKRYVEMSFHVYRERTRVDRVEGKQYKRYSPFTYFKVKDIFCRLRYCYIIRRWVYAT